MHETVDLLSSQDDGLVGNNRVLRRVDVMQRPLKASVYCNRTNLIEFWKDGKGILEEHKISVSTSNEEETMRMIIGNCILQDRNSNGDSRLLLPPEG